MVSGMRFLKSFSSNKTAAWMAAIAVVFLASPAAAEVKYMVARDGAAPAADESESDDGEIKRLYVHGGYNFHFPIDPARNPLSFKTGGTTGAPTGGIGFRWTDIFRAELGYENLVDKYEFGPAGRKKMTGHAGFANFIFDARLPAGYRLFRTNPFVPFVGLGAGAVYYGADELKHKVWFAYDLIGGVSVEINRTLALAFSYKYIKVVENSLTIGGLGTDKRFAPSSHNFGASFRMNF
jgi:opacity protein-like surface antigen